MPVQYIGYRIEGFYKMASLSNRWEGIMGTNAEQKLDAIFWNKHGLNTTRDAFQVSRSRLHRWRKVYDEAGPSALHDHSRAPHRHHHHQWPPLLRAEICRLHGDFPNLGKDKRLGANAAGWCAPALAPSVVLIADAPDTMRCTPQRLTPKGRHKPFRRRIKPRLGKGFRAKRPGYCVAFDTVVRFVERTSRRVFTVTDHAAALPLPWWSHAMTAPTPRTSQPCQRGVPGTH